LSTGFIVSKQKILEHIMATNLRTKFLLVDASPTMLRIIRNLLKEIGYTNFDEAYDMLTAFSKLRTEPFDFVISDFNLPMEPQYSEPEQYDGLMLLREIRAEPALCKLPVLILIGRNINENIIKAEQAGANGCLVKPFNVNSLDEKITKIFENLERVGA